MRIRKWALGVLCLGVVTGLNMSDTPKYPREYPTVPGLDEIDPKDFVALKRARDQRTRERY